MQKQSVHTNKELINLQHALDEHAIVTITDTQGIITYANQKFTNISGYSQDELLGQDHQTINSGMHDSEFFQQLHRTISAGQIWQGDICNRAKNGYLYWTNTTIMPFMNKHGEPEQYIAMQVDITRQKDLDRALQISEERLAMAMSAANDGIWDWQLEDNSVYFDERYYTMAGYQPFEFAGEFAQFQQRVHPDHIEWLLKTLHLYLEGKTDTFDVEFKFRRKNNSYMWIRGRGKIVKRDYNGKPLRIVGTHTNITRRKYTEQELIESEQRYRQIFESSQAVKLIINQEDDRIVEANEAAVRFYGYDIASLTSMSFLNIVAISKKEIKRRMLSVHNNMSMHFECRHQLASGEIRDVEAYFSTLKIGEKFYLYLIVQDVSERIKAEKQLRRAQKMDAIGQLTGGISHDFNNILGIISGNMSLLERQLKCKQLGMDEKAQKRINVIKHSTQRAIDLTRQLLNFSRAEATNIKVVDINRRIKNMNDLVSHSLTPQVEIEHKLAEDLWLTEINPSDLEDSLLNLLLNARDAMSGNGKIIIESRNIEIDIEFSTHSPELSPGEYIELSVSDNGEGMSADQQEHIFEPFYTTKEHGKGTGLGLAMVFGFVQRSNGSIKVYSESGIGTTFRLYLPRYHPSTGEKPLPVENIQQIEKPAQGTETILVVDDEPALLELVQETLQDLGYRVLSASNGKQALQILSEKPAINLLFSDVIMPGINGLELAKQAHQQYPDLKILLTSGYTEKAIANNNQSQFTANMLTKPYSKDDLAQRLRQVLDKPIKNG